MSGDIQPQRLKATGLQRRKPFGRSARGAVDQIGYALRRFFALISAKSESIFCSRSSASSRVVPEDLSFGPAQSLFTGDFGPRRKIRIEHPAISLSSVGKENAFLLWVSGGGWRAAVSSRTRRACFDCRTLKRCRRSRTDFGGPRDE